ncbi:MAG: HNH endonuclease [Cyclobacteriaceae bacterium]|jgi:5-methylcytosine-specific restriction protein A
MKTYLFAWNPKKWDWTHLEETIDQLEQTGRVSERWSCRSHKSIRPGDRAFLVKLGTNPKGIIGAGFVLTEPFLAKHWSGEDKLVPRVMLDFEVLLNPDKDPILTLDILKQGKLNKQNWTPQSSGISVRDEVTDELEAVWFDFLTTQKIRYNPFKTTDVGEQRVYTEGTPNQVTLTKYERNPFARKVCIDHYGLSCVVCKFNFQEAYGQVGKDFIHVHHLTQVSKVAKKYEIDPIKDLRPVCPNCHAMIHRKKTPYTIDEMIKFRLG